MEVTGDSFQIMFLDIFYNLFVSFIYSLQFTLIDFQGYNLTFTCNFFIL